MTLSATGFWRDPETAARYPVRWSLQIPMQALALELSAHFENQAGNAWLPFWAGPVRITSPLPDPVMKGSGFMQLTGYQPSD